ncbi:hypothetical protein Q1695_013613 [Nippostrongylus brasiliensis]|nr:hypothetical protein Q1695_013613 [Nippostrongylus brasiliensis]
MEIRHVSDISCTELMFYYYLFPFCLLPEFCSCAQAHYVINRNVKDDSISKRAGVAKLSADWSEYIDEVIEKTPDSLPLFENLRLGEISRSKPGLFQHRKIFQQGFARF